MRAREPPLADADGHPRCAAAKLRACGGRARAAHATDGAGGPSAIKIGDNESRLSEPWLGESLLFTTPYSSCGSKLSTVPCARMCAAAVLLGLFAPARALAQSCLEAPCGRSGTCADAGYAVGIDG